MVESVRRFGRYTGDVVVYTDRGPGRSMPGATVIMNNDVSVIPHPIMGKSFLGKTMDVTKYDRVAFLDADVVAVAPIAPLFSGSGLRAPVEIMLEGLDGGGWFSLPSAPRDCGPGINAGTVIGDAKNWNWVCQTWWDAMVSRRTWESKTSIDQAMFNHLHCEGVFTVDPLPGVRFLHAHVSRPERCCLVHMRGSHKRATMRAFIDMRIASPPIAVADAADRCSIVRLKIERLGESEELREEFETTSAACAGIDYSRLYEINGKIWDLESDIRRGMEQQLGWDEIGRRAIAIRNLNAQRIAVRNELADEHGGFHEVKGNHASEVLKA